MRVPAPRAPQQPQAVGHPLRVALVGELPGLRADIQAALHCAQGVETVAETGVYGHPTYLVRDSAPDVVLMDFDWLGSAALETCRALTRDIPMTRIVAMAQHCDDERLLRSALISGVRGYVSKSAGAAEVVCAINTVAEGAMYVDQSAAWLMPRLLSAPVRSAEHDALSALTPREREILELVARGYDNRRIARALTLADKTVRNNVSAIFTKIGVNRRAQAVVRAREAGLGLAH